MLLFTTKGTPRVAAAGDRAVDCLRGFQRLFGEHYRNGVYQRVDCLDPL